jgi:hypothetical protein
MKTKRLSAILAVMALSISMVVTSAFSFAATHDTVEDASTDTATITLGKILTAAQANKFPTVTNFNFTISKVEAWKNANTNTANSGETIAVADMPAFSNMSPAIGSFASSATGDTSTVRTRTQDVTATFTQAGYYVYKVVESGSTPANVAGVTYDDHSYFIVVYVCNKTDANGNTIDGVYVHDITSYRNESGSETYKPTLTDIANTTDNGGTAASENTRDNLAKVGKSTPTDPDALAAYKFWNDYASQNIEITKNVTGALGDRTKEFEFTVSLTGLDPETAYQLSSDVAIKGTPTAGTYDATAKTITTNASGAATFVAKLTDDQKLVIEGLNVGSHYSVSEAASDHKASYAITSTNTATAAGEAPVIANASASNSADNTALATSLETVDATDQKVTVAYTNERTPATITGLSNGMMALMGAGLVLAGMAVIFMRKKNSYEED